MLPAHRRYLMRQAGPVLGEVQTGSATPIVGAFSDAMLFEDPWTPPSGTASAWEPATMARSSSKKDRPYRGEAIPYMLGAIGVVAGGLMGGPIGASMAGLGVGAVAGQLVDTKAAWQTSGSERPVFKSRAALKAWALDNRIPVTADWSGIGGSEDARVFAYGAVLVLPSANDRIDAAHEARRVARMHPGVFFNMAPLGGNRVLVYFSEDPAGFLIQQQPSGVPAASYVGALFGNLGSMLKRSPEQKKARLASLEAKYKAIASGDAQPGPLESQEGLLRKVNRLRGELGMNPLPAGGEAKESPTPESVKTEGFDETGRFFRRPLALRRPVAARRALRRAVIAPYRPLRPLIVVRRPLGGPAIPMPVGVPMEGSSGSPEDD